MVVHDGEFTVYLEKLNNLAEDTILDQIIQKHIEYIHQGQTLHCQELSIKTQKCFNSHELSLHRVMVLKGLGIKVLVTMSPEIFKELHINTCCLTAENKV